MKTVEPKENIFSINNIENYKKKLDTDTTIIVKKYYELIIEFYKFISEKFLTKNNNYKLFIIMRGLDTINHIFNYTLYYTKNIDLTIFNCQQGFYFYCEFVDQITEEQHAYLQLSSRDASIYVYKKTIFELLNDPKKNKDLIEEQTDKNKFILIEKYIEIYKSILFNFLNNITGVSENNTQLINKFEVLCVKLNLLKLDIEKVNKIQILMDRLIYSIHNHNLLFDVIFNIFYRLSKNTNAVLKKYIENITEERISELLDCENQTTLIEQLLK